MSPAAPRIAIHVHDTGGPRPLPPCPYEFPSPLKAPADGFVGYGRDFAPSTVIAAYREGIFPWPHPEEEYLWFSPDPRAVIEFDGLHISARLARTIRQGRFRVTMNAAFEAVLEGCAERGPDEGTWITPAYCDGYLALHRLGWAHSFEVWTVEGELAGGLYGVAIGGLFGAESMFHRVTDASKVALAALVQRARDAGAGLIDVQVISDHTRRLGAVEIPRREYLRRVAELRDRGVRWSGGEE
ncbi:MAG: leucyl/phenylalanyl-tRNA--protein transferase [Anaerolinea sp.]|nr:leucyl/phenylalanyl-tRNA--protein transferase [Anaerolinea sp.]